MTQPAGGVHGAGMVTLPAQLGGMGSGTVLPATVRALPGRQQYLLQVANRELPWTTQQVVATGERVAVLIGAVARRDAGAGTAGAGPAPARVFLPAAMAELLAQLKLPDDAGHRAVLREMLAGDRPFTADQLRAAVRSAAAAAAGAAAPATAAATARAVATEPAVTELLPRGQLPDQPLTREIVAAMRRAGQEPTAVLVRQIMAQALQAGITGGVELVKLAAASGPLAAPVTVTTLLAHWQLPDDALHRDLLKLLLAGGRTPTAASVRELAARAQQWGATDAPGLQALVRQWERDLPPGKSIWLRLRAAAAGSELPPAVAALAQRLGWSAPPGEFSPGYWSRLGLTTAADLARDTAPAGDNLQGIMLESAGVLPEAEAAGAWLDGQAVEAATAPDGDVALPLLFTGAAGPVTGALTVHDREGGGRQAATPRPYLTLALDFSALGAVRVEAVPAGRGYVFTVRGTDTDAADYLAAAGDSVRAAVAALGDYALRFAGPDPAPAAGPGVDVRA